MAQATDTHKTKSAPREDAGTLAASARATRPTNPRLLRARARLRAIHRRRFKESARNK